MNKIYIFFSFKQLFKLWYENNIRFTFTCA